MKPRFAPEIGRLSVLQVANRLHRVVIARATRTARRQEQALV